MPAPTNPPYSVGARVQPRQLNRWLDINKVNKLTRAQTYFSIPVFNVDVLWLGYSELVAVFNYTVTNNFSLKLNQTTLPIAPNYLACITWVDSSYNVHRYKLWESNEVVFFDIPLYTNQQIKHNFRIEIWSISPTTFSSINAYAAGTINVIGSYARVTDYRWDESSTLNRLVLAAPYYAVWSLLNVSSGLTQYFLRVKNLFGTTYVNGPVIFPFGNWEIDSGDSPAPYFGVSTTCSQTTSVDLYTSVLQAYDYRYVSDAKLASDPTIISALSNVLPLVLPATFPANSTPTLN